MAAAAVSFIYSESRERARGYADEATAANTRRAYRADWRDFSAWCERNHRAALPALPETVAVYLAAQAGHRKTSTIGRRLSAIAQAHKTAGLDSPTGEAAVRQVLAGIRRRHGTRQVGKEAAVTADVRAMVGTLEASLAGRRDRALLLLGFAGAFRRSELVALDAADVATTRDGLVVTVRRGKTDQEGAGREVGIPYGSTPATCPVRAVGDWLEAVRDRRGAALPPHRPPREPAPHAAHRPVGGPGGQARRHGRGAGPQDLRRPLAAVGPGHRGGAGRGLRAGDHGADRPQEPARGPAVHPPGLAVRATSAGARCSPRMRRPESGCNLNRPVTIIGTKTYAKRRTSGS